VLVEPDPAAAAGHAAAAAGFLRLALDDTPPGKRAKFWQDAVLADPALARVTAGPAFAPLVAQYGGPTP
jgi:hypothetical protein